MIAAPRTRKKYEVIVVMNIKERATEKHIDWVSIDDTGKRINKRINLTRIIRCCWYYCVAGNCEKEARAPSV